MEGAKLSVSQRLLYGTAFVGGRFAWSKLRRAIGAGRWADEPEGSWRRVISTAVNALESTYSALALVNLLAFLNRGRYRTLTERALQTRLVYGEPHARRMVSYEYLNRQLVWREMSELALFVLPMVSAPGLRRAASRAFGRRVAEGGAEGGAEGVVDGSAVDEGCRVGPCVECGGEPAGARYASTPCGHAFCYYCAASRAGGTSGRGYVYACPRCGESVRGIRQVRAEAGGR